MRSIFAALGNGISCGRVLRHIAQLLSETHGLSGIVCTLRFFFLLLNYRILKGKWVNAGAFIYQYWKLSRISVGDDV